MICIYKCVIHYSVWQGYPSSATETTTVSSYSKGTQQELGTNNCSPKWSLLVVAINFVEPQSDKVNIHRLPQHLGEQLYQKIKKCDDVHVTPN